jgi:7-carboxy-7-deazaguanine synthase
MTADPSLRVTEIFCSIQGESSRAGLPTSFIRLTGCPLRCHYCDTAYAFTGGESMTVSRILERVAGHAVRHVTVTGGEPLAQREVHVLLSRLCDAGYQVSLETSGALDVAGVDPRVMKVLDIKTPGSGEARRNRFENLGCLGPGDEIKFVICDRRDYDWSREIMARYGLPGAGSILFSPASGRQDARALAEWILEDRLPVRFQIQLHKVLWGDERGR